MDGGEKQMGYNMTEYRRELDEIIADVLPADHPVHERLAE